MLATHSDLSLAPARAPEQASLAGREQSKAPPSSAGQRGKEEEPRASPGASVNGCFAHHSIGSCQQLQKRAC